MLPTSIGMLGLEFIVREEPIDVQLNGVKTFCFVDWNSGEIVLASDQMADHKRVCLLHESLHATSDSASINLSESPITSLAFVLDQFLIDNNDLPTHYSSLVGLDI